MFCPNCGDEFRPGFTVCPDCDVSLVDRLEEQKDPEVEELVTIATFADAFEASMARGALEAEGIPAFVPTDSFGSFGSGPRTSNRPWAELKVRASDRARAVELLKQADHR
jgi:uncharacterized Zn finger protein (UPF0148 family)